jgi:hypothetical protein
LILNSNRSEKSRVISQISQNPIVSIITHKS